MALNKIYETPFERLCFEDTPDFSTEEPRKWLEETYNRKGYLNIGDEFIYYNENNGIEKLMYGKVVDKDKYVINRMGYGFNDICLDIICRERDTKRALEINEGQLAKAQMLGSTLFNKKDFIPYHNYIFESLDQDVLYRTGRLAIPMLYIEDVETERKIVDYLCSLGNKLYELHRDYYVNSLGRYIAVVDINDYDIDEIFKYYSLGDIDVLFMMEIPCTNRHLVIFEEVCLEEVISEEDSMEEA